MTVKSEPVHGQPGRRVYERSGGEKSTNPVWLFRECGLWEGSASASARVSASPIRSAKPCGNSPVAIVPGALHILRHAGVAQW
ncbi:hypothetical protein OCAR_5642 [Afipia carboxidovorans OM5]|nr:hypothetical protein OCAR_5642 [Afipia carboxidovorans OM5]